MRLTELEPQFVKFDDESHWHHVDHLVDADGLLFVCPVCFRTKGERPGCHSILCWQPRVPAGVSPGPGRWSFSGTSYEDITLSASSNSIYLTSAGCGAHFFITNGEIILA